MITTNGNKDFIALKNKSKKFPRFRSPNYAQHKIWVSKHIQNLFKKDILLYDAM